MHMFFTVSWEIINAQAEIVDMHEFHLINTGVMSQNCHLCFSHAYVATRTSSSNILSATQWVYFYLDLPFGKHAALDFQNLSLPLYIRKFCNFDFQIAEMWRLGLIWIFIGASCGKFTFTGLRSLSILILSPH